MQELWPSLFRIVIGLYWLYFASQKWQGIAWMKPVLDSAARVNPIPGLHEFLVSVVVPNWMPFALAQSVAETVTAVLLILGLATRWAGVLGFLLAVNLALTVAFVEPSMVNRWVYYLLMLGNLELAFNGPGALSLDNRGIA